MTTELLDEAMLRVPGIAFVDGPAGRRAVVGGTGLDVWEMIATWQSCDGSEELLRQSYPWLTEIQFRAALAYYEAYPKEIEARLHREAQWDLKRVRKSYPSRDRATANASPPEDLRATTTAAERVEMVCRSPWMPGHSLEGRFPTMPGPRHRSG